MKKEKQPHGGQLCRSEKGETGNPNGRPRRFVSTVIKELQDAGHEPVKPAQVVDVLEQLLNLDIKSVSEIANDDKNPFFLRQVARLIIKDPQKALDFCLDRAHGRPKQTVDHKNDGAKFETPAALPPDLLLKIADILQDGNLTGKDTKES